MYMGKEDKKSVSNYLGVYVCAMVMTELPASLFVQVFTAFNDEGKWLGDKRCGEWFSVNLNENGTAVTAVPVTVDDNGHEFEANVVAGLWAAFCPQPDTLQPVTSWLMMKRKKEEEPTEDQ